MAPRFTRCREVVANDWSPTLSDTRLYADIAWRFPIGTKVWKEFVRDGVRVETRLLEKTGTHDADWRAVAYAWNDAQTDAIAAPNGVVDARGPSHDVPAASRCMGCHGGTASRVLGISAIQLPQHADGAGLDLAGLFDEARLTSPPRREVVVPGDPSTRKVLGYQHANCGHCHNRRRPTRDGGPRCYDPERNFDLSLTVDALDDVTATPRYSTAVGNVVVAGDPERSTLFRRVRSGGRFEARMPPLATERIDPNALPMLRHWIEGLDHDSPG